MVIVVCHAETSKVWAVVIVVLSSARQFDESIHDQIKVHKEAAAVWDIPHFQEIYQEKCGVKREDAEDKLKLARERERLKRVWNYWSRKSRGTMSASASASKR